MSIKIGSLSTPFPARAIVQEKSAESKTQKYAVSKNISAKHEVPFLKKISDVFFETIHRFKNLIESISKTFTSSNNRALRIIEKSHLPTNSSFLHPKNPAYNLRRLSEINSSNAYQSVCTEEVFQSLPKTNPIQIGYENTVQYQTELGDQAIAAYAALTALGIAGISLGHIFECRSANRHPKFSDCVKSAANIWHDTTGKTILAGSSLLFAAGVYAHRKGWLGRLLHDRSFGWRERQIEALFLSGAEEIQKQFKINPDKTVLTAAKILRNIELIKSSLHIDLQLSAKKSETIGNILKHACEQICDPDPLSLHATPVSIEADPMNSTTTSQKTRDKTA